MSKETNVTFRIFAGLFSLCCISHFSTHLGAARFLDLGWWLACSIVCVAASCLLRFSLRRFFLLLGLQLAHVVVDAPFNPDHWLLLLFVNCLFLGSVMQFWLQRQSWTETQLFERVAPAIRCTFLICYGYAAFSKLNTHFLVSDSSCARELAEFQSQVSPWLKYVMVPQLAGWATVLCEASVALLLIPPRIRRYGVLVGVLFHTILVASPAIAVFDFTMVVYTMLFLFAGKDIGDRLRQTTNEFWAQIPAFHGSLTKLKTYFLIAIPTLMVARSLYQFQLAQSGVEAYQDYWVSLSRQLTWMANMMVAAVVITATVSTLFGNKKPTPDRNENLSLTFRPAIAWQFAILALALLNGACPYLGLKTQGSFTMFSNLRTEGDHWNHLLVPKWVRFVDHYQNDLVQVTKVDNKRLQRDFVDEDLLVPAFEIRRAASKDPSMSISIVKDGNPLDLTPISLDSRLGNPLGLLEKKLLIFRPVTPDGSPYCGN